MMLVLIVAVLLTAILVVLIAPGPSPSGCTRAILPGASVEASANALRPGEVLCLRGGSYSDPDGHFKLTAAGTANRRIEIRSYPGERARLLSHLWLTEAANNVTVRSLSISVDFLDPDTGGYANTLTVYGDGVHVVGNDITNPKAICVLVGANRNGNSPIAADWTLLQGNRVHHCGGQSNNAKHGIYVSDGAGTRILGNLIYANADRGVQLYPNAQRTLVRGNVIDGNGEGLSLGGRDVYSSSNSTIENNVISNSRVRWNVESWWGEARTVGRGNAVRNNCVYASNPNSRYNGNGGIITGSMLGFTIGDNVVADPLFLDRTSEDFGLKAGSPCSTVLAGAGADAAVSIILKERSVNIRLRL